MQSQSLLRKEKAKCQLYTVMPRYSLGRKDRNVFWAGGGLGNKPGGVVVVLSRDKSDARHYDPDTMIQNF